MLHEYETCCMNIKHAAWIWNMLHEYETCCMNIKHATRIWNMLLESQACYMNMKHAAWIWNMLHEYETSCVEHVAPFYFLKNSGKVPFLFVKWNLVRFPFYFFINIRSGSLFISEMNSGLVPFQKRNFSKKIRSGSLFISERNPVRFPFYFFKEA